MSLCLKLAKLSADSVYREWIPRSSCSDGEGTRSNRGEY